MKLETILYDVKDHIATICFNRPQALNAANNRMLDEIEYLSKKVGEDDSVKAVIVTGAGKAFCSGGDLTEIREYQGKAVDFYRHMEATTKMVLAFAEIPKPVIASVNGAAVGAGMNLALACDVVIASDRAKFSEIFSNVGLVPDMGGCWYLPRLVGLSRAKELIYSHRMIYAEEAKEMGIVNRLVPHEDLEKETRSFALELAKGPSVAYRLAKKMLNKSFETSLAGMLELEGYSQSVSGASVDYKEGVDAFFERRTPEFKGK